MSTAVQLKLLTLLNVSAVKRPREADQPGAQRRSISVSPSVQIQPQSETQSPAASGETGEEPPKKKKRGVSFGGEIGPSGSGAKKQKASKKKEDVAINGTDGHTNGAVRTSTHPVAISAQDTNELDVAESQLLAEEDTDHEDGPANGTSSSVSGKYVQIVSNHMLISLPVVYPQWIHSTYILRQSHRSSNLKRLRPRNRANGHPPERKYRASAE